MKPTRILAAAALAAALAACGNLPTAPAGTRAPGHTSADDAPPPPVPAGTQVGSGG
jgi:hypothetical protein